MKPRTKRQKEVFELSQKLKPLTINQQVWFAKKAFDRVGVIENKRVWCVGCNNIFKIQDKDVKASHCKCPICGKKLNLTTGAVKMKYIAYGTKLEAVGKYQVLREFTITHRHTSWSVEENTQSWITEDGVETIIARPLKFMLRFLDDWNFNKPMSIQQISKGYYWHNRFHICFDYILPRPKLQSWIKRAGYKTSIKGLFLNKVFQLILTNSKYETLLKADKMGAIKYFSERNNIDDFWAQVKICLRHHYEPYDWSIWCDYIKNLKEISTDIHNPKFVCPADLKQAHDSALSKVDRLRAKKRLEEQKAEIAAAEVAFAEKIAPYLKLCIKADNCIITPLKSVAEFAEEGIAMHHCVFTNGYYKHDDCLILSARIDGRRTETAEIKLSTGEIVQCRGKCNQNSEYHDMIVSLINKNMKQICRCN